MSGFEKHSVEEIRDMINAETTFDGKLLPDMAVAYKIKSLVDELVRRALANEKQN